MVLIIIIRRTEAVKAHGPGKHLVCHGNAFADSLMIHQAAVGCEGQGSGSVLPVHKPVIQSCIIGAARGNVKSRMLCPFQFTDISPPVAVQIITDHQGQCIAPLFIDIASHIFLIQGHLAQHQKAVAVHSHFPCSYLVAFPVQCLAQIIGKPKIIVQPIIIILAQAPFHHRFTLCIPSHDNVHILKPGLVQVVLQRVIGIIGCFPSSNCPRSVRSHLVPVRRDCVRQHPAVCVKIIPFSIRTLHPSPGIGTVVFLVSP